MARNQLLPSSSSPSTTVTTTVIGAVVAVVVAWVVLKVVLGLVFGVLGLLFPIGLIAGGIYLMNRDHVKLGGAAAVLGVLAIIL